MDRRNFFKITAAAGLITAVPNIFKGASAQNLINKIKKDETPKTNIEDALKYPRNENSMPGKFPGKVVQLSNEKFIKDNKIIQDEAYQTLKRGMLSLTGKDNINDAWKMFVSPNDRIGLKVNPIGGPLLSTSQELTKAIIQQLEEAGIPKKNILIWDRRSADLNDVGFKEENYPGIKILATEIKDKGGSFTNKEGKLYSEEMIDKDWYYWADYEEKYDADTMPYMINDGKYSYFSRIVTKDVDKIINVPILKNAGGSITVCMKNLAFGSISNTGRLHKFHWAITNAEVCAFPPLRDKVVLNIVDGIKGCFNGGPAAEPQFITNYNTILLGTDPVAVDRICFDIIQKKRIEEKIQKEVSEKGKAFMDLAQNLKLGIADPDKIKLEKIVC